MDSCFDNIKKDLKEVHDFESQGMPYFTNKDGCLELLTHSASHSEKYLMLLQDGKILNEGDTIINCNISEKCINPNHLTIKKGDTNVL